jgi:hypothetical protein
MCSITVTVCKAVLISCRTTYHSFGSGVSCCCSGAGLLRLLPLLLQLLQLLALGVVVS